MLKENFINTTKRFKRITFTKNREDYIFGPCDFSLVLKTGHVFTQVP